MHLPTSEAPLFTSPGWREPLLAVMDWRRLSDLLTELSRMAGLDVVSTKSDLDGGVWFHLSKEGPDGQPCTLLRLGGWNSPRP